MKINENLYKFIESVKINRNQLKSFKIDENQYKSSVVAAAVAAVAAVAGGRVTVFRTPPTPLAVHADNADHIPFPLDGMLTRSVSAMQQ